MVRCVPPPLHRYWHYPDTGRGRSMRAGWGVRAAKEMLVMTLAMWAAARLAWQVILIKPEWSCIFCVFFMEAAARKAQQLQNVNAISCVQVCQKIQQGWLLAVLDYMWRPPAATPSVWSQHLEAHMNVPQLVFCFLGVIWNERPAVWEQAAEQKCWTFLIFSQSPGLHVCF